MSRPASGTDLTVCGKAFAHLDDMANVWAEWHPDQEPTTELPARDKFLRLCAALDDSAQLCLTAPYAKSHSDTCKASLDGLPARPRQQVLRLFSTGESKE